MSAGWIAFFSAIAGGFTAALGILATEFAKWLGQWLRERSRRRLLTEMLSGGHQWRTLTTISNVSGLAPEAAKELLIKIGARGSETDPELWGLVSRNPLPTGE